MQYVLCHSRPKIPLLLGLVYVLPYHRRHERRAAAAATRRAAAHCSETRQNVQKEPKIQRHGFD